LTADLVDPEYHQNNSLLKTQAQKRAEVIKDVSYRLSVDVNRDSDCFQGKVEISFTQTTLWDGLFLDYKGRCIRVMQVNDTVIERGAQGIFKGHKIFIPLAAQREGLNRVVIEFVSEFVRNGAGV